MFVIKTRTEFHGVISEVTILLKQHAKIKRDFADTCFRMHDFDVATHSQI